MRLANKRPRLMILAAALVTLATFVTFKKVRWMSISKEVYIACPDRYAYENIPVLQLNIDTSSIKWNKTVNVAVGCAITTRGIQTDQHPSNSTELVKQIVIDTMPLFRQLLPSFCETASRGFFYRFYIAYDSNDPWLLGKEIKNSFIRKFKLLKNCC